VKIAASRNEAAICAKPAVNLSARRLMGVVARDMQNKQGDIYCSGLGFKTSGRVLSS